MPVSDEELQRFKEFTGYPEDIVAIQYVGRHGVDAGVDKYFEDSYLYTAHTYPQYQQEEARKQQAAKQPGGGVTWVDDKQWNDNLMSQDRYGEDQTGVGIPAFQIHAADETDTSTRALHPVDNSNAPTRPPSRMSMRDGQETGFVGSSGSPFIGPATRDYYDPTQWALVPSTSAAEILLDPDDPNERRRGNKREEPVFMKPLGNKDPLASVITILGQIPLARNTLVCPGGPTIDNYGSNPEWWKGATIYLTSIIDTGSPASRPSYELAEETQRLVAFMHSSIRSYGSVQSLSNLKALKDAKAGEAKLDTLADKFLAAWSNMGAELSLYDADLFLTRALHITPTPNREDKIEDIPFYVIDIKLDPSDSSAPARTLYDGADGTLWGGDPDGTSDEDFCLDKIAPVLVIRVQNQNASKSGLDMEVLDTWYLDRYLRKNMAAAKKFRQERSKYKQGLQTIEARRKKFLYAKHPKDGTQLEAKKLLNTTINYLNPPKPGKKVSEKAKDKEIEKDKENENTAENGDEMVVDTEPDLEALSVEQRRSIELANQLRDILEKVEKKLKDLDIECERTQAQMAELSKLFTERFSATENANHRYKLRGVSIGPDHTEQFVLVDPPAIQEAEQHEDEAIDVEVPGQWWRLEYIHNRPVKERTNIDNVLEAVNNKTRDVMLVYANDAACERKEIDLSEGLQKFVATDNESFSEEIAEHLQKADELPPAYSAQDIPPNDGRWVKDWNEDQMNTEMIEQGPGFVPDLGESLVSDEEYRQNTDPRLAYQSSQYANIDASASSARDEDVRMGGLAASSVERIESVGADEANFRILPNTSKGG